MERPRLALTATLAGAVVTPSPAQLMPPGFDIAGGQCVFVHANYGGGTLTARLQGSNDDTAPTNWSDIVGAVTAAIGADGISDMGAAAVPPTQTIAVGVFKWVRLNVAVAGGPPVGAGSVSCGLVSPGIVGAGQAGT